jgi:hypothetical protein
MLCKGKVNRVPAYLCHDELQQCCYALPELWPQLLRGCLVQAHQRLHTAASAAQPVNVARAQSPTSSCICTVAEPAHRCIDYVATVHSQEGLNRTFWTKQGSWGTQDTEHYQTTSGERTFGMPSPPLRAWAVQVWHSPCRGKGS